MGILIPDGEGEQGLRGGADGDALEVLVEGESAQLRLAQIFDGARGQALAKGVDVGWGRIGWHRQHIARQRVHHRDAGGLELDVAEGGAPGIETAHVGQKDVADVLVQIEVKGEPDVWLADGLWIRMRLDVAIQRRVQIGHIGQHARQFGIHQRHLLAIFDPAAACQTAGVAAVAQGDLAIILSEVNTQPVAVVERGGIVLRVVVLAGKKGLRRRGAGGIDLVAIEIEACLLTVDELKLHPAVPADEPHQRHAVQAAEIIDHARVVALVFDAHRPLVIT